MWVLICDRWMEMNSGIKCIYVFVLCCVDICGCRLNIVNGRCMRDEVICGVNGIVYVCMIGIGIVMKGCKIVSSCGVTSCMIKSMCMWGVSDECESEIW